MRLQKSMKIDDNEYTIRELTVQEIIDLFSNTESAGGSNQPTLEEGKVSSIIGQVFGGTGYLKAFLKIAMPGTELLDLVKLAPSELMTLWEAVKEVNTHFFVIAQRLELGEIITKSAIEVIKSFSKYAVALSKEAMEEEFGNTDTPSS